MALHRNITLLKWFNFCIDFKLYGAIAVVYFAHITGSYALAMSVFSIAMVSAALLEVPTGVFSDRVGRKWTVVLGAAFAVVYSIFYAVPTALPDYGYFFLVAGAVCEGFSRSFFSGNNSAMLYDTLAESDSQSEFSEMLGKTGAMLQLALGISGVIGGFLATWSFAVIMWLSVLPQMMALLLAFRMQEPRVHMEEHAGNIYDHLISAFKEVVHQPRLRLLTAATSWQYALGEASWLFQAAFMNLLWPVWAVGIGKMASNFAASFSFQFAGRIVRKYGAWKTWVYGDTIKYILAFIAYLFPTGLSPAILSSLSIFYGTGSVAREDLMQREFKPHQRATMGSIGSFAGNMLFGVASFGVGLVADSVSPGVALLGVQILLLPAFFLMWKLGRH